MIIMLRFDRRALWIGLAIALWTGCGGAQNQGVDSGIRPQGTMTTSHRTAGNAWMEAGTSNGSLIYATGGCSGTCVLSYPGGTVVGSLTAGGGEGPSADCSDNSGNVFITQGSAIMEYAHGGSSPIATLSLPGNSALGCSVDAVSGSLAVVFSGNGGSIAIFANAKGTPTVYDSEIDSRYCGYDNQGNLFVSGSDGANAGFSELRRGSPAFTKLKVSNEVGFPGQVQWDGVHITYESWRKGEVKVSRLRVAGTNAKIIGTTRFKRLTGNASQSWIYSSSILVPYGTSGEAGLTPKIGVWKYPGGGRPLAKYTQFGGPTNFQSVTLSI
jgi:hypothetical protein